MTPTGRDRSPVGVARIKPCWQCSTPHESDSMPALCSAPCRDAWRERYQLTYGEPPTSAVSLMDAGDVVEPKLAVRVADEREPASLDDQDRAQLARIEAATAEPAGIRGQQLRAAWVDEVFEPRPADEPQSLVLVRDDETAQQQRELGTPGPLLIVDTGEVVVPPKPPEPPLAAERPRWRRFFRRG